MIQKGPDDHNLTVCVLNSFIVESLRFLLVSDSGRFLTEESVEALFAITEQELLPWTADGLAKLD